MDEERRAQIAARCAAATAGPWVNDELGFVRGGDGIVVLQSWSKHEEDWPNAYRNREFVAHARTDIPALAAALAAAERERDQFRRSLEAQTEALRLSEEREEMRREERDAALKDGLVLVQRAEAAEAQWSRWEHECRDLAVLVGQQSEHAEAQQNKIEAFTARLARVEGVGREAIKWRLPRELRMRINAALSPESEEGHKDGPCPTCGRSPLRIIERKPNIACLTDEGAGEEGGRA